MSLGWIHFSDTARKQVMKIVELLGEAGAIDELGIGVIRNAFSNAMFNGITTPMTRAKYFFITSYLFIDYLNKPKGKNIRQYMNTEEMRVIEELTEKYGDQAREQRIIGYTVAKKNFRNRGEEDLVTKPTVIYWNGMREYGILRKPHSFSQLAAAISNGEYADIKLGFEAKKDKERGDDAPDNAKWIKLFDVPYRKDWRENLSIELSEAEAGELKGKIISTQRGTLIAHILENPDLVDGFLKLKAFDEIPKASFYKLLPGDIQKTIDTAISFWQLLEGAHIRFNILLQQQQNNEDGVEKFQQYYKEWEETKLKPFDWTKFDQEYLWTLSKNYSGRIKINTEAFINRWIESIQANSDIQVLNKLVADQERANKRERSKLLKNHKGIYNDWVGISALNYRLFNAQAIIKDIYKVQDNVGSQE